jgi:hypothetical protein
LRGHWIAPKSRNSCRASGAEVGAEGIVTKGTNQRKSQNQIQTLKECCCCHVYCAHLWYHSVGASRAVGSPCVVPVLSLSH